MAEQVIYVPSFPNIILLSDSDESLLLLVWCDQGWFLFGCQLHQLSLHLCP